MAEKKYTGNINAGDIGDNNSRTLQQIIADATEEELAYYPDETMSKEEIKTMIRRRALKTKNRRIGIVTIAGLIMLAALGIFVAFDGFITDVDADKNPPQEIITQNGVVIEDGGWGSSSDDAIEITDWNEVSVVKYQIPGIFIPYWMPKGYDFKNLIVENLSNGALKCVYVFSDKNGDNIEMHQFIQRNALNSFEIGTYQKIIETNKGKVYIENTDDIKIATILLSGGSILKIWYSVSDSIALKIIENFNN